MGTSLILKKENNELMFEKIYKFIKRNSDYEQVHHYEIIAESKSFNIVVQAWIGEDNDCYFMEKIPTSKKIVPQDDILDHILDRITSINKREDLYFDEETYNQFTKEKTIESKLICNTNVIEDKDIKFEQYFYVFNDSLIVTEVPSKNAESFEEVYGYNFQKSIINTEEIYRSLWHQTYD